MKLYHPDNPKNKIDVDEGRADLLKRSGWLEAKKPEPKSDKD